VAANNRSRGPWLANGLCCPAGSSLTMASSAAVVLSRPFLRYRPGLYLSAEAHRVPNLLCLSLLPCRLPYPGGQAAVTTVPGPPVLAFAPFQ